MIHFSYTLLILHLCQLKLGPIITREVSSLNCHRHYCKLLDHRNNVTEHQCYLSKRHVVNDGIAPSCLLQSAGGEANRILLASALSSMRIICPNRVSRRDWIIAVSLGCFVSLRTSSFRTNWYHLMPSSIRRHHWSSASILRASVLDIAQQSEP